jgi:hypothetical protein
MPKAKRSSIPLASWFNVRLFLKGNIMLDFLKSIFGFAVIGDGFVKKHFTFTYSEATQWAACYPSATVYKRNTIVATKRFS